VPEAVFMGSGFFYFTPGKYKNILFYPFQVDSIIFIGKFISIHSGSGIPASGKRPGKSNGLGGRVHLSAELTSRIVAGGPEVVGVEVGKSQVAEALGRVLKGSNRS
jgi:hypothetical protein